MILPDVNVLVCAFRTDAAKHMAACSWLNSATSGTDYAMSPQVLCSFIRITTNRRVFAHPDPLDDSLRFAEVLRNRSNCHIVEPGPQHWQIYRDLCRQSKATGDLTQDAWFAAMAIESGCEWITLDRGYARFPGLRWRTPF